MNILLLSSSYNSLTQHAHVWLKAQRHEVAVSTSTTPDEMRATVARLRPDLVLCPMLAHFIPRDVWERYPCIIIHPGIVGDRGASSLDWAILNGEREWGVTAVQAAEHADSGAIWASFRCDMRGASKSSLYRDEITDAAMKAIAVAVQRFESGLFVPAPLDYSRDDVRGRYRAPLKATQRPIDWTSDAVATIERRIWLADGSPGVLDEIAGQPVYLYGVHEEGTLIGKPGDIIGRRNGAICRAAVDGAVWISHMKRPGGFKLPAELVLGDAVLANVPEVQYSLHQRSTTKTLRDVWYEERNDVGYVNFRFYNGAMGTDHCRRLEQAVLYARQRPTRVIVFSGGRDFFSNGIHLNLIEAAADPALESWNNINAMDDLVHALLTAEDHITIAAMYGSAGAGGVMMAIAADRVLAREGIVLNPHYKTMGGLYGSEYWTYSLPKRVGAERARQLTERAEPISVYQAKDIGLIDNIVLQDTFGSDNFGRFREQIIRTAEKLCHSRELPSWLRQKKAMRAADEKVKPLAEYRREELEEMKRNFWGDDDSYHRARTAFVRKQPRAAMVLGAEADGRPNNPPARPDVSFATLRWPQDSAQRDYDARPAHSGANVVEAGMK